ncbi:Lipopolysaccharide export system ATP-binding protein LptB [Raoultella terrigena]|uniref:Lipopolysaccharide export system ATP-binding protein LptB n=1 Tax=Raoultella terrigena TaxID=577 RepID=A0A485B478_RAOTE|nr:Lipopolysaccharide export system ATP-binding protein LptB [Raoultella terrigena]
MTLFICALLVAPMVASQLGGNYWVRVIDFALLYIMLALGLNIVVGYTGLLDMGFIAFYAVGAYLAALLASPHLLEAFPQLLAWFPDGLHTSWLLIIPLAALVAAGCGIVLGAPTLKLRGDYLAIVTLGFGEIIRILMRNLDRPVNITNGAKGISGVDTLSLFGLKFSGVYHWFGVKVPALWLWYYLLMLVIVAIIFVCLRLQHSRIGRAWHAIREDEDVARAMGINLRNYKLLAFAIGASFGGVAGALFGAFQGFVSPESFTLQESIAVLAMVVLGGMGHIPGVILGAVLLTALPELLRSQAAPLQQALFGEVLIDPEILRQLFYGPGAGAGDAAAPAGHLARRTQRSQSMSLLSVSHMSKRFGGLTAVDNVSLAINEGEIYGLIGPNGAGKTTCFNLITGLYPADSGEFAIAGQPYFPKKH